MKGRAEGGGRVGVVREGLGRVEVVREGIRVVEEGRGRGLISSGGTLIFKSNLCASKNSCVSRTP